MKNTCFAFAFLFCAISLLACSDPVRTASREVDRLTRLTQKSEAAYKRVTKERMTQVVAEERAKRDVELTKAGCDIKLAPASQPAGVCATVVAIAASRYNTRMLAITQVATKLDAATGMVYAALLATVDILDLIELGLKDKVPDLAKLIAAAADKFADFVRVYDEFRVAVPKL